MKKLWQTLIAGFFLFSLQTFGSEALLVAVKKGDVVEVERLLKDSATNIEYSVPPRNETALFQAVVYNYPNKKKLVELLIRQGANVDAQNSIQQTALMILARHGKHEEASWLLNHRADPNLRDIEGNTALMYATSHSFVDEKVIFINRLIAAGAYPNLLSKKSGMTALTLAISGGFYGHKVLMPKLVKALLQNGADPNISSSDGYTPLMHLYKNAISGTYKFLSAEEFFEVQDVLLNTGADLNLMSNDGNAVIFQVISGIAKEVFDLSILDNLKARRANFEIRNLLGETPLIFFAHHYASYASGKDVLKKLISLGVNINAQSNDDASALWYLIHRSHRDFLIRNGASLDLLYRGKTMLMHFGQETAYYEILNYLIDNGANVNVQDKDGNTVLHGSFLLKEKVISLPSTNLNIQNNFGQTPLFYAVHTISIETVEQLVKYGANLNLKDSKGRTALSYAQEQMKYWGQWPDDSFGMDHRYRKIVETLRAGGAN